MIKFVKEFCIRGLKFAWGGPFILAIVWGALQAGGAVTMLTVNEAVLGIITTTMMAFISAGISVVYQIETLPKAFAGLIQAAVLYMDYLGFYLLNGWVPVNRIWIFTLIFAVGFVVIWLSIFIPIKLKVDRMNKLMNEKELPSK